MSTADKKRVNIETPVYGSTAMASPAPTDTIPMEPTSPEIAYQMVKDETYPQTQPRLNLATFVTTYMDPYATKLMNEAIDMNYIDETEYPRVAVMTGRCINIVANLWHSPEKRSGRQVHWRSVLPRPVCWAVWPRGCAGAKNVKRRANPTTNRIS